MQIPIHLDRNAPLPLQDQLFEQLRQMIIAGNLKPNSRVIATRFLAEQANVSRTTVLLAYERLIDEGYLETRPAIGTFVCASLPDKLKPDVSQAISSHIERQAKLRPSLPCPVSPQKPAVSQDIHSSVDMTALLPTKTWLRGVQNVFDRNPNGMAGPVPPTGTPQLRQAIGDWLAARRGIMVAADQVIIVSGRRQACGLIGRMFLRVGDRVVVEAPGDTDIADVFQAQGAALVPVTADEHGIQTDRLPQGQVALASVSPARQNPLGGILSQQRREQLIAWAYAAGAYLIEDDIDSELRYSGTPPIPLASTDPHGLVFFISSFTKTLGNGLNLGFLIVPPEFAVAAASFRGVLDNGCSWLEQMALADIIAGGDYDSHLRRLRKIYMERRDALLQALQAHFGEARLIGTESGTQMTWLLPEHFPAAQVIAKYDASPGFLQPVGANSDCLFQDRALILNYAAYTPVRLAEKIANLAGCLSPFLKRAAC